MSNPDPENELMATLVKALRFKAGLQRRKLADLLNITEVHLKRIEEAKDPVSDALLVRMVQCPQLNVYGDYIARLLGGLLPTCIQLEAKEDPVTVPGDLSTTPQVVGTVITLRLFLIPPKLKS